MPPLHVSCPAKAKGAAGNGSARQAGWEDNGGGGKGRMSSGPAAESRLMAQLAASKAELAKTKSSLAEARKAAASAAPVTAVEDSAMAGDGHDGVGLRVGRSEVKSMQAHLKALRELPMELQSSPGIACDIADLDCRLQAAFLEQREAKPLDVQLASSEAHLAKMQRLEDLACKKTAGLQAKQAELAVQVDKQLAAQADAEAKTHAAKEELAKVKAQVARNLAEEAHAVGPAGIVVPPGCVSIEHAEAVLAEQLALRDAALAQAIAVAEAAPDEPDDDTASVEDSAAGPTADEANRKRARKQRAMGAKATIAHVRSHTFAKPRWGSWG